MIININRTHPEADRPLIDFNVSIMMIPMTMGGAVFGTIAAKLLPNYILQVLLVFLLWFVGYR